MFLSERYQYLILENWKFLKMAWPLVKGPFILAYELFKSSFIMCGGNIYLDPDELDEKPLNFQRLLRVTSLISLPFHILAAACGFIIGIIAVIISPIALKLARIMRHFTQTCVEESLNSLISMKNFVWSYTQGPFIVAYKMGKGSFVMCGGNMYLDASDLKGNSLIFQRLLRVTSLIALPVHILAAGVGFMSYIALEMIWPIVLGAIEIILKFNQIAANFLGSVFWKGERDCERKCVEPIILPRVSSGDSLSVNSFQDPDSIKTENCGASSDAPAWFTPLSLSWSQLKQTCDDALGVRGCIRTFPSESNTP